VNFVLLSTRSNTVPQGWFQALMILRQVVFNLRFRILSITLSATLSYHNLHSIPKLQSSPQFARTREDRQNCKMKHQEWIANVNILSRRYHSSKRGICSAVIDTEGIAQLLQNATGRLQAGVPLQSSLPRRCAMTCKINSEFKEDRTLKIRPNIIDRYTVVQDLRLPA